MPISLVLADFDGTLADSMPFWARLPRDTLRRRGVPEPADMDELIRGHPMWEIARILSGRCAALGESDALYRGWMETMAENYRLRIPLKPGARELLAALRSRGVGLCLLSATNHGLLDPALEGYGLTPLFDAVVTEGDAGSSKRGPAPYELCMARLGAAPAQTLLLEDSLPNIRAAAALGLRTCGVYDESMAAAWDALRAQADAALPSLTDPSPLLALLDR